ncbi:MAG: hypothetical protein AABZ08_04700 [Planctomycetota bacterium]
MNQQYSLPLTIGIWTTILSPQFHNDNPRVDDSHHDLCFSTHYPLEDSKYDSLHLPSPRGTGIISAMENGAPSPPPDSDVNKSDITNAPPQPSKPPSLLYLSGTTLFCAWIAYVHSTPYGASSAPNMDACFTWSTFFVLLGYYLFRLIRSAIRHNRRGSAWRWIAPPLLLALALWARETNWLLEYRFEQDRTAFEAIARTLLSGKPSAKVSLEEMERGHGFPEFEPYGKSIGSFDVPNVSVFPAERVVYFLTGGFFRSGWGFVYNPSGQFTEVRDIDTCSLDEAWETFYFDKP